MVQGAERERRNLESRDLFLGTKLLDTERRFRSFAMRREQSNGLVRQTPQCVCDDSRRRCIQPLDVVDRDQDRTRVRDRSNHAERADGSFARLNGRVGTRLTAEKRDLERVLLRRRQ